MPSSAHWGMPVGCARTLPLRVTPVTGEALDSWLEAIAHRYSVSLGDILLRCGIRTARQTTLSMVSPTRDALRRIGIVCAIDCEVLQSMSLNRYRDQAADNADSQRESEFAAWPRRTGSRFCPHCLRENRGRWDLTWRLNWSFACTRHRCLLADTCPACGSPQRREPLRASKIPRPGHCPSVRHYPVTQTRLQCNADLGTADAMVVSDSHHMLHAQTTIHALLTGDDADFALYRGAILGWAAVLSDVRLLAKWIIHAVDQTQLDHCLPTDIATAAALHRRSTAWPDGRYRRSAHLDPSAIEMAAAVSLALQVISRSDTAAAVSVLQRLMRNADNGGPYRRPIARHCHLSPTLRHVLDTAYARDNADRKLRTRLASRLATAQLDTYRSPGLAR